jgi:hypothetical protein
MTASRVQARHRKDTSSTKGQGNYTKDGVSGSCQFGEAGKEGEGIIEDPSGGDEVSIFNFNFQFFNNFDPKIFDKK